MLWREPFPKPPLSRVDPDWSIPTLFGALFRDDFSLSQSRHLWDWLLLWLFHYCYTHFFLPPENRHHPNSQVFTPKYSSPISDPPLCWCGERKCKDTDSLLALPCKGCSSGTELCSPRSPVLFLLSAWFSSPLWGKWKQRYEYLVWVGFFSIVVWKKFTTNTQTKTREYMSGSLGVQGTAHQTSIYIQTPVI